MQFLAENYDTIR